jgi:PAS domain S-box-containing protein
MLDISAFMSDVPQDILPSLQRRVVLFPEALLILDTNATIIETDKRMLTMFGWQSEDEIIGKNCKDLIVEQEKQTVADALQKALTDGHIVDLQCNAIKKDGSYLRISFNGSFLTNKDGSQKKIILVIHDITPHLSELEQVREAQRQLTEAQQIAHFGSWEWDIPSNKFRWTDEMYKLFSLSPQSEVNNDSLMAYVMEEDREKVKSFINQSISQGSGIVDFRFVDPQNGSIRWFHSRGKTFFDTDHRPLRMVGTVHDVTREKELDQVKTQFLSMASHQMRGPLTTINWHAEMLLQSQSEGLSDTQRKYIQELYNASKRTVRLTNDILTVSELELGRMPFKPEKLSLPKVAKRVLEDYDHKIAESKINFKEVFSENLPEIQTDLFLLKTIFHELVSNAISYTPNEGTITLTISVDPTRTSTFLISVADTGYGIPKEEQEKIFSKMYRATNAKVKVMGGTGLGLYIVKLILQLNGGEIWFTSEENKGTTFNVAIPFVPKPGTPSVILP